MRKSKAIIGDQGFYRWPNGARIPSDPRGIKFVIDQGLQMTASPVVTVGYLQVEPVGNLTSTSMVGVEMEEEEEEEDEEFEEMRGAYPVIIVADGAPAKSPAPTAADSSKMPLNISTSQSVTM